MMVKDCIDRYEDFSNRVHGFSPQFCIETFIEGIKLEIHNDIILFDPKSVTKEEKLALIQEVKLNNQS